MAFQRSPLAMYSEVFSIKFGSPEVKEFSIEVEVIINLNNES